MVENGCANSNKNVDGETSQLQPQLKLVRLCQSTADEDVCPEVLLRERSFGTLSGGPDKEGYNKVWACDAVSVTDQSLLDSVDGRAIDGAGGSGSKASGIETVASVIGRASAVV